MGDQFPQYGNATTHNLEAVLHTNILNSRYSRGLEQLDFNELIDEIYSNVKHVEPWMSGNARGPSTAFCCLNRLFELRPSPRQVRTLLLHEDSPYIRAIGFLFLRYVAEPRTLWSWFEEFLRDKEEFAPSADEHKTVPMGLFIRELLLDQFYFETIFPRIPENISRTLKDSLARLGFATAAVGCAGVGGSRRQGGAADEGPSRRPPSVKAALSVSLGQRAPHVAGVREDGRGFGNVDPTRVAGAGGGAREGGGAPRPVPPEPPRDRGRENDRERDYARDRGREQGDRRDEPRLWRPRSRSRSRKRRSRSRSRSRSRDRHRHHSHHRRSRSRERDRDRDRDRERHHRRSRSHSRSRGHRERSREAPSREGPAAAAETAGRSADDVFRALAPPLMASATALKERY